jgi:hypothetical protein
MPDLSTDYRTKQGQFQSSAGLVAPLPPATIARRRRALRLCLFLTIVGGIGLNLVPGPKNGDDTVSSANINGVRVQVHKYTFSKPYGVPFVVARAELDDAGGMKDLKVDAGTGIFGNFGVAFAISFGLLALLGRRRRND